MKFNLKYVFVFLLLMSTQGILFSHVGGNHYYGAKNIDETKFITVPKYENRLSEYGKCIAASSSSCNCCYGAACFGFDYKCGPYDCNDKEVKCHFKCSQSESDNRSLPVTTYPMSKITVNFSIIKISDDLSVLKSSNIFSSNTSDKITTPTYISIRVLLI